MAKKTAKDFNEDDNKIEIHAETFDKDIDDIAFKPTFEIDDEDEELSKRLGINK